MEKLIEHLNLGPHDVTTIDTTVYVLPNQRHEDLYNKKGTRDTTMSELDTSSSTSMEINHDEKGKGRNPSSRNSACRNQRKKYMTLNKKRARRRERRMDIMEKTVAIRSTRTHNNNNIQKKLERSQRRRCKKEKETLIRKKRQLKVKMKMVQRGVAMFHL